MKNQRQIKESPFQKQGNNYHFLSPGHIQMIDEALFSLGDFGEVRLVVEKGRLRFLVTQVSYDAFKWQPGVFVEEIEP